MFWADGTRRILLSTVRRRLLLVLFVAAAVTDILSAAPVGLRTPQPTDGVPTSERREVTKDSAKVYLRRFGHIRKKDFESVDDEDLKSGVKSLQKLAGLQQTGELDEATVSVILTPRCGVPDDDIAEPQSRRKRYATSSKWATKQLTFRINTFPNRTTLSSYSVVAVASRAYKMWTDASQLKISYTTNSAPINVGFYSGDHGDGYPFVASSGVLAHTFMPTSGRVHFNDAETWTDGTAYGRNLLYVATHEFGHSIGMSHSSVKSAVMYPYYPGYKANLQLDPDDIAGIQALYGAPLTTTTSSTARITTAGTTKPRSADTIRTIPTVSVAQSPTMANSFPGISTTTTAARSSTTKLTTAMTWTRPTTSSLVALTSSASTVKPTTVITRIMATRKNRPFRRSTGSSATLSTTKS